MKLFFLFALLFTVYCEIETVRIGQPCPSYDGFVTTFFNATPPQTCTPYQAKWKGTFINYYYCPSNILIHQSFDQRQGQYQVVYLDNCFENGQEYTFTFKIVPYLCVSGMYGVQIYLNTAQETISCWQYTYTIS